MGAKVLVRHNTALLERAVDLVVKQAAIPTLQAEAVAHDKIARANAFRRLMTGAAVAIAAVGIGYGAALFFGRELRLPPVPDTPEVHKETDRIAPSETVSEGKTERSTVPVPEPAPRPKEIAPPEAPKQPDVVTEDFNKFLTRELDWGGSHWSLVSGHHFSDEHDPTWDRAWCYTRRLVNGVDVNVDLANRPSPTARPQAPAAPMATLASIGLNDASALELASKCAWLDNRAFSGNDYEAPPGRAEAAQKLIAQDGWDAMGFDLPSMPVWNVSFDQCQTQCEGDNRCLAITYDKKHSACFM
ncbi:PAN/Apple domain-containing protein, partial [Mesorhizobium sp. P5_C1]